MFITPSFEKSFIVEQFQGNYLKRVCKKSDAYKQLICIMQRVHFEVRVAVFSCQDKYCGKKTNVV